MAKQLIDEDLSLVDVLGARSVTQQVVMPILMIVVQDLLGL
jgi:hypothetical protein